MLVKPMLLSSVLLLTASAFTPVHRPARRTAALHVIPEEHDDSPELIRLRQRFEMSWKLDESDACDLEDPHCASQPCTDCDGTGRHVCRFCRGTRQLYMDGTFCACNVCENGHEMCKSCQGTGWVADFVHAGGSDDGVPFGVH